MSFHKAFTRHALAATLVLTALMASAAPALSNTTARQERISTAKAAKVQSSIEKTLKKFTPEERAAKRDMLNERVHLCTLVNRLLANNPEQKTRERKKHRFNLTVFTKLLYRLSETYTTEQYRQYDAEARKRIRQELSHANSARLQIVFNSCVDIQAGKIFHALSNLHDSPPEPAPADAPSPKDKPEEKTAAKDG